MAHVVVLDSSARRAVVKTTPGTHLSDVLEEACSKLGLNAANYGLKNNNKQVDLSLTYRLSGLPSGAKLQLVQLSRSASVVSVALQLPESEARGIPNGRLTDKFPSNTTLWLILRKFEAGVAGGTGVSRNLTARGTPSTQQGVSGAGRLYYERPVLHAMGRELSSFTDLQKTLGQLGFNNGSALLRLSFRVSDTPLEEAMEEIEQYFKPIEGEAGPATEPVPPPAAQEVETPQVTNNIDNLEPTEATVSPPPPPDPMPGETLQDALQDPTSPLISPTTSNPLERPITVFRPSESNTPQAARHAGKDSDFIPTVDHMKRHQASLLASSRPQRLPTDAEIASAAQAASEKLSSIKSVEVKIRFPDENQVVSTFNAEDTGETLYAFVRSCLDSKDSPFQLTLFEYGSRVPSKPIPNMPKRLIQDMGFQGRVLAHFSWGESASYEARTARFVLKPELRQKAQRMKIAEPEGVDVVEDKAPVKRSLGGGGNDGGMLKGIPKWLKLGKK